MTYESIAREEDGGAPLKFAKGEWLADDVILNGARMVAEMDKLAIGWRKWLDGRIVASDIGFVSAGFQPKDRADLGDLVGNEWPLNSRGERNDPWQFSYFLRLTNDEGRVFAWAASSAGARKAIGKLTNAYLRRKTPGALPIVELKAGFYRHPEFGKIDTPELVVVGWTEGSTAPALPASPPPLRVITSGLQQAQAANPIDDDIPF